MSTSLGGDHKVFTLLAKLLAGLGISFRKIAAMNGNHVSDMWLSATLTTLTSFIET